ncbi:acidic leucine-rich nuclear phosphoprotein 32-related protein-like [Typha latifolia]|uniref:acidic leucine-rich nuclear phosphoprotein 32-related protein-like n=1 Tax=Typha latifolia TaxID=4733 RepID=UPI003C2E1EED
MDEAWERAVETALGNHSNPSSSSPPRSLTLDGAVKCLHGRLPPPWLLERYQSLEHLSIANVGVSSLEKFPRLRNLTRLILSDNRIAGGLEFLVEAGLDSLRDLDLSNNRIQFLEDLAPLANLRLVSLDLYECPVTRVRDYRSRVFGMIRTLRYLDKMDADENERPETDEEEEEEEEDDDDDDDPESGEVDGDERNGRLVGRNGGSPIAAGVVDVDEEESDADEEEMEVGGRAQTNGYLSNGFGYRVAAVGAVSIDGEDEEDVEDDGEEDEEEDLGEEIDEEEVEEEDVVEVHDVDESDEDEDVDGVEEEREEGDDDDEEDNGDVDRDGEDVEDEDDGEAGSTGRMASLEGEIDGHDQGEDDENGEIGDEEEDVQGLEEEREYVEGDGEDEDEEEDIATEYLVQPIVHPPDETRGRDFDACNEEDEDEDEVDDDDEDHRGGARQQPSSSHGGKRKRDEEDDLNDDSVEDWRSSKHH